MDPKKYDKFFNSSRVNESQYLKFQNKTAKATSRPLTILEKRVLLEVVAELSRTSEYQLLPTFDFVPDGKHSYYSRLLKHHWHDVEAELEKWYQP